MKITRIIVRSLILLCLCNSLIAQSAKPDESGALRLGMIFDILRLDAPDEPLAKRNRTLIYGVRNNGIDFMLTDAIAADLKRDGANDELIAAIKQVSDANKKAEDKKEAQRFFRAFEACGGKDYVCRSKNIENAIILDPTEKLYSDWQNIIRNEQSIAGSTKTVPLRGNKSGKILYRGILTDTEEISNKGLELMGEFDWGFISRLKSHELDVQTMNSYVGANDFVDYEKLERALSKRAKDQKALHYLPYALIINTNFDKFRNMPDSLGLKIAVVSGSIDVIDTENGKTMASERFADVRGFGNTQIDARRNAMKLASTGISEAFIKTISNQAR